MQTATSVGVRKLCLMSTVDDESVCVRKREMASANPRPPERPLSTEPDITKSALLYERFVLLNQELLTKGVPASRLKITAKSDCPSTNDSSPVFLWCLMPVIVGILMFFGSYDVLDGTMKSALSVKCVLPNNYVVWEATRPVTDCRICQNLSSVIVVNNLTRTDFKPFAYSYKPIIVKGAALDWLAVKVFDFQFFKKLYDSFPDAHKSVEEDCQFLNFKSNFSNLEEVFAMSPKRAANSDGTQPWYIGWSNCHPEVLREMRKYYSKPHFLPEDAEHSHIDFVFMGYQQGAFMHLDYISRLMWQAQLRGRKSWRLTPPPECERVCSTISFTVQPGDILLLDTRQWYHDTYVLNNEFSLTVSSEYG